LARLKTATTLYYSVCRAVRTGERGEVLLTKKMGIVPPIAPVSSAPKGAYDAIFVGNLTSR